MTLWDGERKNSWASNGNISVYIFFLLFAAWMFFQVWSRLGDVPPPVALDPMVMAALGVAITTKSVERKAKEKTAEDENLELKKALDEIRKQIEEK